jgi:hypothetical protein
MVLVVTLRVDRRYKPYRERKLQDYYKYCMYVVSLASSFIGDDLKQQQQN